MATPPNPLSYYNSHTYYHVLVMCDSTMTASALSGATDVGTWLPPQGLSDSSRYGMLGKYAPKSLPAEAGGGQYVVLINGATTADFSIEQVKWMSTVTAFAVPDDNANSIANEGSMMILEPRGIKFLDTIVLGALSLGIDITTCPFLLKTFFIGYKTDDSGNTSVDTISDVEPLLFHIMETTGQFTEQGGQYMINFVGIANGVTRLPQFSRVGSGLKMSLNSVDGLSGVTLASAMASLQQRIQYNYDQQYHCLTSSVNNAANDAGLESNPVDKLAKISYRITIDEMYDNTYLVTDTPAAYKNTGSCVEGINLDMGANASIEAAISEIMSKCPKVNQDASEGTTDDNTKFSDKTKLQYKIKTAMRTFPGENGTLQYEIHYHVLPFVSAVSFPVSQILVSDGDTPEKQRLEQNVIEFDYIYTGKNIDVLAFDIKMNLGRAYLQIASQSNSLQDQLEVVGSRTTHSPTLSDDLLRLGQPVQIPVPFGIQLESKNLINSNNPTSTTQAAYTINKAASVEVSETSIKIVGNYNLLNTVNIASRITEEELIDPTSTDRILTPDGERTASISHWGTFPAFAKINIRMPVSNDHEEIYNSGQDYSKPFWYGGYFHITTIENDFDGGHFTQNLSLVAIQEDIVVPEGGESSEGDQTTKFRDSLSQQVQSCFDNDVQVAVNNNEAAIAQPYKRADDPSNDPQVATPTTNEDVQTMTSITDNGDPSIVKKWDKASAVVQEAIWAASRMYGTPIVTLAAFAFKESSFNPSAAPPAGTALGLYQHIKGTWMGLVRQGKISGIPSNMAEEEALALRTNPTYSARGGAAYINEVSNTVRSTDMGDIYLGYFAGPGTAKKVIAAARQSQDTLLSSVVSKDLFKVMKRNNPTIISDTTTAYQLQQWAKRAMSTAIKGGIPVAAAGGASNRGYGGTTPPSGTDPGLQTATLETQATGSRTAAEALSKSVDPAVIERQQTGTICGDGKIPPVNIDGTEQEQSEGGTE